VIHAAKLAGVFDSLTGDRKTAESQNKLYLYQKHEKVGKLVLKGNKPNQIYKILTSKIFK